MTDHYFRTKSIPFRAHQIGQLPWPKWLEEAWKDGRILMDGQDRVYVKNYDAAVVLQETTWIMDQEPTRLRYMSDTDFRQIYEPYHQEPIMISNATSFVVRGGEAKTEDETFD